VTEVVNIFLQIVDNKTHNVRNLGFHCPFHVSRLLNKFAIPEFRRSPDGKNPTVLAMNKNLVSVKGLNILPHFPSGERSPFDLPGIRIQTGDERVSRGAKDELVCRWL
jgi:hypothetical protein